MSSWITLTADMLTAVSYTHLVAALAHKLGLVWGGDWRSPYDPGHVQLGSLPTATLHRAYTTGASTLAQLR